MKVDAHYPGRSGGVPCATYLSGAPHAGRVTATLSVFLSLYNIFISLLNLLLAFSGQRD